MINNEPFTSLTSESNIDVIHVWIVTYWDETIEPTVSVFNNKDVAKSYYNYLTKENIHCCIDYCPIYSTFIIT